MIFSIKRKSAKFLESIHAVKAELICMKLRIDIVRHKVALRYFLSEKHVDKAVGKADQINL